MLLSHTHCHSISIPGSGGTQPFCLLPGLRPLEKCLAESGPSIHICRINIYLHNSSTSTSSSSEMMRLHRIMNLITLRDKEAFLMLLPPCAIPRIQSLEMPLLERQSKEHPMMNSMKYFILCPNHTLSPTLKNKTANLFSYQSYHCIIYL